MRRRVLTLTLAFGCACALPSVARAQRQLAPMIFAGWERTRGEEAAGSASFLYEAATLERGAMGIGAGLGFPYLVVDGAVGVSDRTDLRLSVRALYGLMSQLTLEGRVRVLGERGAMSLALRLAGSYAFYQAQRVAMSISGTRDAGARWGLVASMRGSDDAVFFVEAAGELAFDLHPEPQALGGLPPPFVLLVNLPVHAGVELKISPNFHLTSVLGVDAHFASLHRRGEPAIMPYVAVTLDVLH